MCHKLLNFSQCYDCYLFIENTFHVLPTTLVVLVHKEHSIRCVCAFSDNNFWIKWTCDRDIWTLVGWYHATQTWCALKTDEYSQLTGNLAHVAQRKIYEKELKTRKPSLEVAPTTLAQRTRQATTTRCRAVTLPRRETSWNLHGCPKWSNRSQPLVGRSSPYYEDMWRRYCCFTSFFRLSICALVAKI